MSRRAFVTLHDVAPHTLDDCRETLAVLRRRGVDPVTLLVVPGTGWTESGLDTLRFLAEEHPLAGHGWSHRAPPPATVYHRLHGALISRDEGEHLSRGRVELRGLVERCAHWFEEVGLGAPDFYVPPAWAMGRLRKDDLAELPFRWYETLTGVRDADVGAFRLLPLVGYMADTPGRAWSLRVLNALNRAAAAVLRRPLRVSIHPPDLRLRIGRDLLRFLERDWDFVTVEEVMDAPTEHSQVPGVS
jgi:predicted deacetylase